MTWLYFTLAVAFITTMGWLLWTDIGDWYDYHQHEALLDELWDEDDLADSA